MLAIAFVVAVVFILGLGAILQWWSKRESPAKDLPG